MSRAPAGGAAPGTGPGLVETDPPTGATLTPAGAGALQPLLAARVQETDALPALPPVIGGADASTTRFDPERRVDAALVALAWPGLALLGSASARRVGGLPYIPGLLGFREVPALLDAWERLVPRPGVIFVDGHGRAHPRGLGIASHLGVVLGVPTIGVAKSILVGRIEGALGPLPGARAPLVHRGAVIGWALRTRARANPVYVSVGHRVALPTAVAWVEACLAGRRLPEPTRLAHLAAGAARRAG